jgi:hypothetical protein
MYAYKPKWNQPKRTRSIQRQHKLKSNLATHDQTVAADTTHHGVRQFVNSKLPFVAGCALFLGKQAETAKHVTGT